MSEIVNARLDLIDANPMRRLPDYPYNSEKIDALRRSIADVGLWEGVIARRAGRRYQIAFGHHRIEAARRELGNEGKAPLIIRDLSDEEMLQFMGRENLEDWNADFLIMLESWEAASSFRERAPEKVEPLEIAAVLGWSCKSSDGYERMNATAKACNAALKLIDGRYLKRKQLSGLSVKSASEICQHVASQHQKIEQTARHTGRPAAEVEQAKKIVARAGGDVADDVRKERVAQRDIRGQIDFHAYKEQRSVPSLKPLFTSFGARLADSISNMLSEDSAAEKLKEIKGSLSHIETDEDVEVVERIGHACVHLSKRADKWAGVMSDPKKKIVKLKEVR